LKDPERAVREVEVGASVDATPEAVAAELGV
jgi:hypothetical protein